MGDPSKRYLSVRLGRDESGQPVSGFYEAIPRPDKPGKFLGISASQHYREHAEPLIQGPHPEYWGQLKAAGFVWAESNYERYWAYRPDRAFETRYL